MTSQEPPTRKHLDMGVTVWFTGLSGAGKSTLCQAVHCQLLTRGYRAQILDGDQIRQELTADLGFGRSDRDENIRRIAFVAELLARNGVIVLVAAISPYSEARRKARAKLQRFIEVYVNAPLAVCESRDPKGLYKRARRGEIRGFTGIDDPYEEPLEPDVECVTDRETVASACEKIIRSIELMIRAQNG